MANNFASDANCKALYRFEDGALTVDDQGGNTLTSHGSPTADTTNFAEGAASVNLINSAYYSVADASLDAGFPLKSGDTNKKISVVWWMRITTNNSTATYLFAKYAVVANGRSLGIIIGTSNTLQVNLGYNSGNSFEALGNTTDGIPTGKWLHCAFTFDNATKAWRIKVYNATDGSLLTNQTGTSSNNIYINSQPFHIGVRSDVAGVWVRGKVDEYGVFDDILTDAEIDDIRNGAYGAAGFVDVASEAVGVSDSRIITMGKGLAVSNSEGITDSAGRKMGYVRTPGSLQGGG